jgi:hypothetical protein
VAALETTLTPREAPRADAGRYDHLQTREVEDE